MDPEIVDAPKNVDPDFDAIPIVGEQQVDDRDLEYDSASNLNVEMTPNIGPDLDLNVDLASDPNVDLDPELNVDLDPDLNVDLDPDPNVDLDPYPKTVEIVISIVQTFLAFCGAFLLLRDRTLRV